MLLCLAAAPPTAAAGSSGSVSGQSAQTTEHDALHQLVKAVDAKHSAGMHSDIICLIQEHMASMGSSGPRVSPEVLWRLSRAWFFVAAISHDLSTRSIFASSDPESCMLQFDFVGVWRGRNWSCCSFGCMVYGVHDTLLADVYGGRMVVYVHG